MLELETRLQMIETRLQMMEAKQDEALHLLVALEYLVAGLQVAQASPVAPAEGERPTRQFVFENKASTPLTWYRRRPIVAEDLAGKSEEEQLVLIIEGFKGSEVRENKSLVAWARTEYRKLTGTPYNGEGFELLTDGEDPEEDQLDIDLAKLRAIPREELVKPDGKVNQSAIARQLNLPTGGGKWGYIQELASYLQDEYDQAEAA